MIDIDLRQLLSNIEAEKGIRASKEAETRDTAGGQKDQQRSMFTPLCPRAYVRSAWRSPELSAGIAPRDSRSTRVPGASRRLIDRHPWLYPTRSHSGKDAFRWRGIEHPAPL